MSDQDQQQADPAQDRRTIQEIREQIAARLDEATGAPVADVVVEASVVGARDVEALATALERIDLVARRAAPATPPPFDEQRLKTEVWGNLQDRGYPTEVSDQAVAAIAHALKAMS